MVWALLLSVYYARRMHLLFSCNSCLELTMQYLSHDLLAWMKRRQLSPSPLLCISSQVSGKDHLNGASDRIINILYIHPQYPLISLTIPSIPDKSSPISICQYLLWLPNLGQSNPALHWPHFFLLFKKRLSSLRRNQSNAGHVVFQLRTDH